MIVNNEKRSLPKQSFPLHYTPVYSRRKLTRVMQAVFNYCIVRLINGNSIGIHICNLKESLYSRPS